MVYTANIPSEGDGSCLVLSMRHLGDAVIGSGLINALRRHNPSMVVDVLGRPELEEVIRTFSCIRDYIGINLPVFGHHRQDLAACLTAVRTLRAIRRRRYDYCINPIGDIRENVCGFLCGAKWNIAPIWEPGHLFKLKMTDFGARWAVNCGIIIPAIYPNFYTSLDFFARQLGLHGLEGEGRLGDRERQESIMVAIHAGASHGSRLWPSEKWRLLVHLLRLRGYEVKIMGARSERAALLVAFDKELAQDKIELVTEDIAGFAFRLAGCDVLIGMDSFSVHAAYALGVPAVVLNGSADPLILTPPGGVAVSAGNLCKAYPCYYRYPCRKTEAEYICSRGIEPGMILDALDRALEHRGELQMSRGDRQSR